MSKIIILLFMILLCGNVNNNDLTTLKENITISSEEFPRDRNVKIECYKEGKNTLYKYSVYNNEGKKIYYEDKIYKDPTFKRIDNKIIRVSWSAGTGLRIARYFDIQTGRVSEIFITPRDEHDTKIVRFERPNKMIVQDMFDCKNYYEETLPLLEVADINCAILSAKFINEKELKIRYYNQEKKEETKKILFDIN